jgi:hypothetical protein
MAGPTQLQLNTAIESWRDTSLGVGYIAANTRAYNQVFNKIPALEANAFAVINDVSEAYATGTLTFTAGTIADDKIEIGGVYYVPVTTPSGSADGTVGTPWQVARGANAAAFLANLRKAVNASGVAGTDYSTGLTAHPSATSTASDATTLTARALIMGSAGNLITTSVTAVSSPDGFAWGGSTLTGGVGDDVPAVLAVIAAWRDTLRAFPMNADPNAEAQLDAAIPALNTAVSALFT